MTDSSQPGSPDGPEEDGPDGSPPSPFGPLGPLGAGGAFDLAGFARMLQSDGPVSWELAEQTALWAALEGATEAPVDADERRALEALGRAAQSHVADETGRSEVLTAPIHVFGRDAWVRLHLTALRPVLEALALSMRDAMTEAASADGPEDTDLTVGDLPPAFAAMLGGFGSGGDPVAAMIGMVAPFFLGLQAGSMVGHLGRRALGRYDLPLPVQDRPGACFVPANLAAFEQDWSLPRDELRFYIALHETTRVAQRSVPWVQPMLVRLASEYVAAFELDPGSLGDRLGGIDLTDPNAMQSLAEQPAALLGAMRGPRQEAALLRLRVFSSVLEGWADLVLERIGTRLLPSFARVHEAMKRHRIDRGEAEQFVEGLLGLDLGRDDYERGLAFCRGVVERAGMEGLDRLWESEAMVPTPAELDAPGLWLARIDLPELTDGAS